MTTAEINEVFRSLGLETEEKREMMRSLCSPMECRGSIQIITTDSTFGSVISNGGSDVAHLEPNSQ